MYVMGQCATVPCNEGNQRQNKPRRLERGGHVTRLDPRLQETLKAIVNVGVETFCLKQQTIIPIKGSCSVILMLLMYMH